MRVMLGNWKRGMPGRGDGLWWESEGEVMSEGGGRGVGKE